MRVFAKIAAFALVAAVSAGAGFVGGSAVGFIAGHQSLMNSSAPADAVSDVAVLRVLRKGDDGAAISLLENRVDSLIMQHYIVTIADAFPFIRFSQFSPRPGQWNAMYRVAQYRKENPCQSSNEDDCEIVARALSCYRSLWEDVPKSADRSVRAEMLHCYKEAELSAAQEF